VVEHRGVELDDMDLEAVLRRAPDVALVDELAHTNAPDGRHEKRWQDVEELLAAGISVVSTVNVQHMQSLGDVVREITGTVQRETVPDAVVRAADQVEVVD
ncbi:histidine kinase, partial [Bacillus sp. S34]|nr:histidine kinase [Bacillus sp. S34]